MNLASRRPAALNFERMPGREFPREVLRNWDTKSKAPGYLEAFLESSGGFNAESVIRDCHAGRSNPGKARFVGGPRD
jgi:hypothetical protein